MKYDYYRIHEPDGSVSITKRDAEGEECQMTALDRVIMKDDKYITDIVVSKPMYSVRNKFMYEESIGQHLNSKVLYKTIDNVLMSSDTVHGYIGDIDNYDVGEERQFIAMLMEQKTKLTKYGKPYKIYTLMDHVKEHDGIFHFGEPLKITAKRVYIFKCVVEQNNRGIKQIKLLDAKQLKEWL